MHQLHERSGLSRSFPHKAFQSLKMLSCAALLALGGCATVETHQVIDTPSRVTTALPAGLQQVPVTVGAFTDQSAYQQGLFSDGVDRAGQQAQTLLAASLTQSGRFRVLDRSAMQLAQQEADLSQRQRTLKGADFVVTGQITGFGRKEVGDRQLFGVLGKGKTQVAYAKVTHQRAVHPTTPHHCSGSPTEHESQPHSDCLRTETWSRTR